MKILGILLLFMFFLTGAFTQQDFLDRLPDCAVRCLEATLPTAICSSNDINCLCADVNFMTASGACNAANCSVVEMLRSTNETYAACGIPVRDRTDTLMGVVASIGSLALLMVVMRLVDRAISAHAKPGWDDLLIGLSGSLGMNAPVIVAARLGFGRDMWAIPPDNITASLKWLYVAYFMYMVAESLCQLSILAFYLRIMTDPKLRLAVWVLMGLVACFGLGNTFAMIFQCKPIPFFWDSWRGEMFGSCPVDVHLFGFVRGGVEIFLDLAILILPLPMLANLNISKKKKLQIMSMFCVGFVITVVSCLRLCAFVQFAQTQNPTNDNTSGLYWCATESNLFTVVACMPAMRAILHKAFRRFRDASGYASKGHYGSDGPGKGSHLRYNSNRHQKSGSLPFCVISKSTDVNIYRTERSDSDVELIASDLARLALQDLNKKILETLEVNNEILDNIHEEFKTIVFKGEIKIHSFQEAQGISDMKGLDEKVVDDFSSKLDLPRALETVESIDANHMQMARYSSKDDQGYRAIAGILKAFVHQELISQQIPPVNVAGVSSSNALFMVPFSKDDGFVSREDIIAEISEHRAASQTHTRVALVGLGGVGKSQIAIEYAYRVQKAEPHTLVVWIHASNPIRFKQGYRGFADKVPLPGREDPKADILQLVHGWLSDRKNGQWLMILDNVDDDSVSFADDDDTAGFAQTVDMTGYKRPLESFLPQTPNGTVLVTSRNKTAAINLVGGCGGIIQIEPMEEEDALALLQTRVPFGESGKADAKALVHALDRIPLAITHAAAYIKARAPMTTMSAYLELFRNSEANQVRLLGRTEWKDLRRDHSIRHAVIATWQISFSQIRKTERPAADLLALMSMFDKQGIPRWLLQANTSQLDFDDALAPLLSFSLVRTEIGEQALEMHRLVQLSMRIWLEAEKELSKWTKESIRALSAAFPSGDYATWTDCKVLLPHAKEIVSHVTEDEEDLLNKAESVLRAGWYLYLRGEYTAAEAFVRMSVDSRERVLGPEHPNTLTRVSQLGSVLESQGKYDEAEAMHRRALEGYEKVLGPEHPDTLTSVYHLAFLFHRQHQYSAASVLYQGAYNGYTKALGARHPTTVACLNHYNSIVEEMEPQ